MARQREFDTEQALDAAMDVFWSRGYEGTSAQDLCDGTGLGRGSLYNAFTSKHLLYLRALRRYYAVGIAPLVEILSRPEPARQRLREMMVHTIDVDLGPGPRRGCLAINAAMELADHDPEVRATVQRHFARVEDEIRAVIEQGQRDGEIDASPDSATAARTVMSAYYGLRVLAKTCDDRQALLAVVDATLAAL